MTGHPVAAGTRTLTEPGPFVCVIEEHYRDLAVARDARAGVFTHAGLRLELGRRPDWLAGGPRHDEEWRIEWVKCYEGLSLAHEYVVSGRPDSLAAWADLVDSFCERVPVGHDTSDVSARRIQNWLYAWQRFAAAPAWRGLPAGLADRLSERLVADGEHLRGHLTAVRNHRTLELYALLVLALAFGHRADAAAALADLADNAAADVLPDGVHCERSSDYHMIVLRSFLGAVANARLAGLAVPPELERQTRAMCDVALHLQRPDGRTPALSDGDPNDYRPLLRRAAALLRRPDLLWAASGGLEGSAPATRSAGFPVGGYHVQRSGWGAGCRAYRDERWAVLDCGPLGEGGHGHYDQLSVELMAAGRPLVVDPGRFTYAEDGSGWRAWFKGTAAHNTVTVDGLDQTPYRRGKPKGPTSTARLRWRHTEPGLDVLCGEVESPRYDARHSRSLALVADDYWVVLDRLRAGTAHDYVAHWQLPPEAAGRVALCRHPRQTVLTSPSGTLVVPAGYGAAALGSGWVSPAYGTKLPAPVLTVAAEGRDADLVTVLTPGGEVPTVTVEADDHALVVEVVSGSRGRVRLHLGPAGARLQRGGES